MQERYYLYGSIKDSKHKTIIEIDRKRKAKSKVQPLEGGTKSRSLIFVPLNGKYVRECLTFTEDLS